MKPPPPGPATNGSLTPSALAVATAASIALPPCRSTRMPARLASRSAEVTAPPEPTASGCLPACFAGCVAAPGGASVTAVTDRTAAAAPAARREPTACPYPDTYGKYQGLSDLTCHRVRRRLLPERAGGPDPDRGRRRRADDEPGRRNAAGHATLHRTRDDQGVHRVRRGTGQEPGCRGRSRAGIEGARPQADVTCRSHPGEKGHPLRAGRVDSEDPHREPRREQKCGAHHHSSSADTQRDRLRGG